MHTNLKKNNGRKWKRKAVREKVLLRKDNGFKLYAPHKRSVGKSLIRASRTALVFVLSFSLLFLGVPRQAQALRADTAVYDPQSEHLIVQYAQGTDLQSLAEACRGELVRIGPLDYCTLQFEKANLNNNDSGTCEAGRKEIENRTLSSQGVLDVHWSKKFKVDGLEYENYQEVQNN